MSKIIIVGGVAGGATAAARLRRLNENDSIIMFERDEYISFANCGLPYYIGGTIKNRDSLFVQTAEGMKKRFNIDVRTLNEVISIDSASKKVTVRNVKTNETYEESYDKLILSAGAKPVRPPIDGINDALNVFTLRNIPDTDSIKEYITDKKVKNAVVIGGGFIGVEMAENLTKAGVTVTLVEKMPQVLRPLDFEMSQIVHAELNINKVNLILNDGISAFENRGKAIRLESGIKLDTDMTVLAIGVTPDNSLAKQAGFAISARGHVITNDTFNVLDGRTNQTIEDIYAIGDMIEVIDFVTNGKTSIPLAWPANRQGRLVADHISGISIKKSRIQGTSVIKVFGLVAATTGINESQLKASGLEYTAIHAHRANHAAYYPDSSTISLKLVFDEKTGRIYGAQAVGREGTEKRIDVIATVMKLEGTVYDLPDLELSYAPPFSSAKDPSNILGYIAENLSAGAYKMVYWNEMDEIIKKGGFVLDVRTPDEYSSGHIAGSANIELDSLRSRLSEINLPKNAPVYVYCQVGLRAYIAIKILSGNGFTNLYNLSGGYMTYKSAKYSPNKIDIPLKSGADDMQNGTESKRIEEVDVSGLQCPGPLMAAHKAVSSINMGESVKIISTDLGFARDIENWCKSNGHSLVSLESENGKYKATIKRGASEKCDMILPSSSKNATIVVFSGELDKTIAAMIIAQGAVAQGKNVTLFFTFWGLNALRRPGKIKAKKNFIERMFGFMMPKGASRLPLSNMNMAGIGPKMIKGIMKNKNVDDIDAMIKKAKDEGVRFIACTMSMDLMGIKKEELIDGIEYAGVATYMAANENASTTLFV